jgi:hypothetical protein
VGAPIRGLEPLRRTEELEFRGWVALLTGLLETYGRERVRANLEAERLWLELQFTPVAVWRDTQDRVPDLPQEDPRAEM